MDVHCITGNKINLTVELLTKCLIALNISRHSKKKDALWHHFVCFIILLRFKAVAERRQWSSAASKPRRRTCVKL